MHRRVLLILTPRRRSPVPGPHSNAQIDTGRSPGSPGLWHERTSGTGAGCRNRNFPDARQTGRRGGAAFRLWTSRCNPLQPICRFLVWAPDSLGPANADRDGLRRRTVPNLSRHAGNWTLCYRIKGTGPQLSIYCGNQNILHKIWKKYDIPGQWPGDTPLLDFSRATDSEQPRLGTTLDRIGHGRANRQAHFGQKSSRPPKSQVQAHERHDDRPPGG